MEERIAVIGLGYVGLPVALAFARKFPKTVGVDANPRRVEGLRNGVDLSREVSPEALKASSLEITTDPKAMRGATFFIIAVPTPIDDNHAPDLTCVLRATESVASVLQAGAVVVYESTVYPGVTEDICGPLLEKLSGLKRGVDFTLGYSPERINPGDATHRFETIVKVVAGENPATLERVAQRDHNIALMNEIAMICDRIGIRTSDVLEAAGSKWNFLRFTPGLVGGHCISVDPYYLTTLAESVGYNPQVILAGRRINEGMGAFIAQRLVKMLASGGAKLKGARVGILGLTFKPDVPDIRNTKVVDILRELRQFGVEPLVHDPLADADEAYRAYGVRIQPWSELVELDAIVLAVPHRELLAKAPGELVAPLCKGGAFLDVKSAVSPSSMRPDVQYWSL
jgi:UDP-N-acetyl-D-galactosamine dehydrogenase